MSTPEEEGRGGSQERTVLRKSSTGTHPRGLGGAAPWVGAWARLGGLREGSSGGGAETGGRRAAAACGGPGRGPLLVLLKDNIYWPVTMGPMQFYMPYRCRLILSAVFWDGYYYYLHCTDKEIEEQKSNLLKATQVVSYQAE